MFGEFRPHIGLPPPNFVICAPVRLPTFFGYCSYVADRILKLVANFSFEKLSRSESDSVLCLSKSTKSPTISGTGTTSG